MNSSDSPETPQPTSPPTTPSFGRAEAANLCAVALGACFWAPWVDLTFAKPTGYDFQRTSDTNKFLWLLPIFCAITVLAGITRKHQRECGQLAAATPFGILIYGLYQSNTRLFDLLTPAAWVALGLGVVLFVLVRH